MRLLSGEASDELARRMAADLQTPMVERDIARFPDGEIHVRLHEELRDADTYVVQSTGPPTQEHLTELLLLADAAHRAGSQRVTAVVPYLAYARQDRRTATGEPVGLRVVAELLRASHVDRIVVVDPHTPALESVFGMPVEITTAVPILAEALRDHVTADSVLVAPDLGAAKLVDRYAELLDLDVAIIRKTRVSGDEVTANAVVGDVHRRRPIIVDDMISTAGTLQTAVAALRDAGAVDGVVVAASHGVLVGAAVERLLAVPVELVITTDSLTRSASPLPLETVSLARRLSDVVLRLHHGRPLDELAAHA